MGTRSVTRVFDGETQLCAIYRQMDGYPLGMGEDLKSIAGNIRVVNGAMMDDGPDTINGAGRVASRVISELEKLGVGPRLIPIDTEVCGQEYEYHIICPSFDGCDAAKADGKRGVPVILKAFDVSDKRVEIEGFAKDKRQ